MLVVVDDVAPVRLERAGETVKLRRVGEVLEFGAPMAGAVAALFARGRSTVAGLEGLDDERRAALARRLLEHGVCRVG